MVQADVVQKIENDDLALFVAWIPMYPGDSQTKAMKSKEILADPRSRQYWDADKTVGKLFRESLGLPEDRVPAAWDVYLVFDRDVEWSSKPPKHAFAMQQLSRDHPNFLDGDVLLERVRDLLKSE